jgi:hypothetical protein
MITDLDTVSRQLKTRKMIVYIAGPMTGLPDFNIPAFNRMAERLCAHGFVVYNPGEINGDCPGQAWEWYMKRALGMMVKADIIMRLEGWENSHGAKLESELATQLGMPCIDECNYWQSAAGGQPEAKPLFTGETKDDIKQT